MGQDRPAFRAFVSVHGRLRPDRAVVVAGYEASHFLLPLLLMILGHLVASGEVRGAGGTV